MNILITDDLVANNRDDNYLKFNFLLEIFIYLDLNATFYSGDFDNKYFQSLLDIYDNRSICLKNLTQESINYLREYFDKYDLLLTFNLTSKTKEIFNFLQVKYIDLRLSPILFCKDVMLEFFSNDTSINKKIITYKVANASLKKRAKMLIEHTYNFKPNHLDLVSNSALLIGRLRSKLIQDDFASTLLNIKRKYLKRLKSTTSFMF